MEHKQNPEELCGGQTAYRAVDTGNTVCISKKNKVYLPRHRHMDAEEAECIGWVPYKKVKDQDGTMEAGAVGQKDTVLLGSCYFALCPNEDQKGRLWGYVPVVACSEEKEAGDLIKDWEASCRHPYVAVYQQRRLPLLLMIILFALLFLVGIFAANRPRDMPQPDSEIPVEAAHAYEDEPVPIDAGGEIENVEAGGNVLFNAYSGVYRMGEGEALPLTNLSGNTVYLRYILKDGNGQEIFSTGLIGPGMQYDFVASDHLAHGSTDIALYAECYAMDQATKYPGSCRFDITIAYE